MLNLNDLLKEAERAGLLAEIENRLDNGTLTIADVREWLQARGVTPPAEHRQK